MTTNTRNKWIEKYRQLTDEAEVNRDSQSVVFGLLHAYDELNAIEKAGIHEMLSEWLVSEDNKLRYDAGFITSQRKIVEMLPAIDLAIKWIGETSDPEGKYELEKLSRIRGELQEAATERNLNLNKEAF